MTASITGSCEPALTSHPPSYVQSTGSALERATLNTVAQAPSGPTVRRCLSGWLGRLPFAFSRQSSRHLPFKSTRSILPTSWTNFVLAQACTMAFLRYSVKQTKYRNQTRAEHRYFLHWRARASFARILIVFEVPTHRYVRHRGSYTRAGPATGYCPDNAFPVANT